MAPERVGGVLGGLEGPPPAMVSALARRAGAAADRRRTGVDVGDADLRRARPQAVGAQAVAGALDEVAEHGLDSLAPALLGLEGADALDRVRHAHA